MLGTATRDLGSGVYSCDPMSCAQLPRILLINEGNHDKNKKIKLISDERLTVAFVWVSFVSFNRQLHLQYVTKSATYSLAHGFDSLLNNVSKKQPFLSGKASLNIFEQFS